MRLSWHTVWRGRKRKLESSFIHRPKTDTALCDGDKSGPAKEYISRNHDTVEEYDLIVAAPETMREELRSGTWATVRYARAKNVTLAILQP